MWRLVGLVGVSVAVAACTSTTGGAAQRGDTSAPSQTTVAAPTTPALVPAAAIVDKLIKRSELATILGDTAMEPGQTYSSPAGSSAGVEPRDCAYTLTFQDLLGYTGAQGTVGDSNVGAGGALAMQLITVFDNREQPAAVLRSATTSFRMCTEGEPFSTTSRDVTQHWVRGRTVGDGTRVGTTVTRQEPPPRSCSHVVAAQANIAVEAIVCSAGESAGQANEIADRLLAKFPR